MRQVPLVGLGNFVARRSRIAIDDLGREGVRALPNAKCDLRRIAALGRAPGKAGDELIALSDELQSLRERGRGRCRLGLPAAVRLEIEERTPARIRDILVRNLGLSPYQVFASKSPIGRAVGCNLQFEEISADEALRELPAVIPAPVVRMLLAAWAAAEGHPAYVTSNVEAITGKPARTYFEWATDHAASFRA